MAGNYFVTIKRASLKMKPTHGTGKSRKNKKETVGSADQALPEPIKSCKSINSLYC